MAQIGRHGRADAAARRRNRLRDAPAMRTGAHNWGPLQDRGVRNLFMAGFDCFDRERIQHGEDLRREAFADLQNMAKRLDCQDAWLAQRQIAQDGSDQILKLFVRRPAPQREGFEPACELRVSVDGLACFSHAEAHERHLHLVAQEPQRVQNHALSAICRSPKSRGCWDMSSSALSPTHSNVGPV